MEPRRSPNNNEFKLEEAQPDKYDDDMPSETALGHADDDPLTRFRKRVGLLVDEHDVARNARVAAELCAQLHLNTGKKQDELDHMHQDCMYEMPWPRFAIALTAAVPIGLAFSRRSLSLSLSLSCVCVCVYVCRHMCMWVLLYVCVGMCVCTHMSVCMYAHPCA
jgi:hypothetical protein